MSHLKLAGIALLALFLFFGYANPTEAGLDYGPADAPVCLNGTTGTPYQFTYQGNPPPEGATSAGGSTTNFGIATPHGDGVYSWTTPGTFWAYGIGPAWQVITYNCVDGTSGQQCFPSATGGGGGGILTGPHGSSANSGNDSPAFCKIIITEAVGSGPADLIAGAITPTSAAVATPVSLNATIANIGTGSTGVGFTVLFELATSPDGAGATPIGTYANPARGPNSSNAAIVSHTFPSAGTWYVRARADRSSAGSGTITESNESNNDGPWTAIVVSTNQPDLTPTGLTPRTVIAGTPATFTGTIYNAGSAAASSFSSTIYVCANSDASCLVNPMALGTKSLWQTLLAFVRQIAYAATSTKITLGPSTLAAGASGTQSGTHTFSSPGTYQMRLCADLPANQVSNELNENNNCANWALLTVCPAGNTIDGDGSCVAPPVCPSGQIVNGSGVCVDDPTDPSGSPSLSCSPSTTSVSIGGTVTYDATAGNGALGPYRWSDPGDPTIIGSGLTFHRTYTTPGQYQMRVEGSNVGPTSCSIVTVGAPYCTGTPTVSITANPLRVRAGQTSTVSWSASGVPGTEPSCTVSGPNMVTQNIDAGALPTCAIPDGTATPVIQTQSTYTINCEGTTDSVTVNVVPAFEEF